MPPEVSTLMSEPDFLRAMNEPDALCRLIDVRLLGVRRPAAGPPHPYSPRSPESRPGRGSRASDLCTQGEAAMLQSRAAVGRP